ncbi:ATP-binding protein [Limosilactobacillus mucosae]
MQANGSYLQTIFFKLNCHRHELQYRRDQEIKKRIQQAKFPIVKRIDEFDFNFQPSINKQEILGLKSLGFLNNHQNILLVGSPGVGKTHLAIGLGLIACEHGFKTLFINCHDLTFYWL